MSDQPAILAEGLWKATMPGWLQAWANANPITHAVDATRAPALGGPTGGPLLEAVAWILGVLAVVVPLAIHRYRRGTQYPWAGGWKLLIARR